ncbi:MAG: hypothetical protein ABUT39_10710 [Acidobacteriota bacterium]
MTRRTAFLLLGLATLFPGLVHAADAPRQKGILSRAIVLVEEPEEKKGSYPMPFGTTPQDVDINSTVRVRISTDELLAGLSGSPLLTPAAQETVTLRKSAEELKKADAHLQQAIADATQLTRLVAEGRRDSPEFQQIAAGAQAGLSALFQIMKGYREALEASPRPEIRQHAAEVRATSNAVLVQPQARFAYAALVVAEIRWTLGQLDAARTRLEAASPSLALILSASLIRPDGTTEVGLPHYNDIPIGVPKSVDKLSLALTPEQIALQEDAAALAQVLNNAVAGSADLREAVRALFAAQGVDLQSLKDALDRVQEDAEALRATNWSQIGTSLEARLQTALRKAAPDESEILEDRLIPEAKTLQSRTRGLQTTLAGLILSVKTLQSSLAEASEQDPVGQIIALLTVAQVGSDLVSGEIFRTFKAELEDWSKAVSSLQEQVGEFWTAAEDLPETTRDEITEVLSQAAEDQLGALNTHLAELRDAAGQVGDQLKSLLADFKGAPALAAALDQPPPDTSFRVVFQEIKDTWLDIRTLNPRAEDDVVVVRAWLYSMKPSADDPDKLVEGEELDSDLQQLRLLRFGWFSNPAVGVVYMSSLNDLAQDEDGEEKQVRAFAPQISWLLRHRAWRTPTAEPVAFRFQPSWWHSLSLGIHTLSLDLDNDNQQELGLGVSVSLFNNFLQIGGGWDVSLDDEPYVFLGTRLLDLARSLGVSRKPAAPEE